MGRGERKNGEKGREWGSENRFPVNYFLQEPVSTPENKLV